MKAPRQVVESAAQIIPAMANFVRKPNRGFQRLVQRSSGIQHLAGLIADVPRLVMLGQLLAQRRDRVIEMVKTMIQLLGQMPAFVRAFADPLFDIILERIASLRNVAGDPARLPAIHVFLGKHTA